MGSTFSGLNTMVKGLSANQLSLNTIGHNITNANATGYSRQSVNLAATDSEVVPSFYGNSQVGTGVSATSITRARDIYADRQYWAENSNQSYYNARQTNYSKVETIYNDSDSTGLQSKIAAFSSAWQTLGVSSGAGSYTNRVQVYESGVDLAQSINTAATSMQSQIKSEYDDIKLKVDRVNEITKQILDLNKNIVKTEANGSSANDLRDARDNLADELSGYVKTNVTENSDGTYSIVSNGNTLVDGKSRLTLECDDKTATTNANYGVTDYAIAIKETGTIYDPGNGEIKGIQDSIDENKKSMDSLGSMSAFLLTTFNDQHKAGYDEYGATTGRNFFGETSSVYALDATKTGVTLGGTALNTIDTIKSLSVNTAFSTKEGKNLIAAAKTAVSATSTTVVADGANAVLLANLFNSPLKNSLGVVQQTAIGTISFNDYYTGMMSSLGTKSSTVNSQVTKQQDIMTAINSNRQSTAGVNWDEELTNMIKFQQGYSASSRCLTTMDSMLEKLISSTGMVGR